MNPIMEILGDPGVHLILLGAFGLMLIAVVVFVLKQLEDSQPQPPADPWAQLEAQFQAQVAEEQRLFDEAIRAEELYSQAARQQLLRLLREAMKGDKSP